MFPRGLAALLAAGALLLASCDALTTERAAPRTPVSSPTGADTRLIGLVGTLSGPGAWRGEDLFEGADVAVNGLNRSLQFGARRFELVSLDDRGSAARAIRLLEQLAEEPRTVGIVYGGPLEALRSAESVLAAAGIPAISCFGDLRGAGLLGPHLFQATAPLLWEARRIIPYLVRDREYRTVGALIERSAAGRRAFAALRAATPRRLRASARLRSAVYGPAGGGVERALGSLRSQRAEAIVVQGRPAIFAQALEALRLRGAVYSSTPEARIASAPRPQAQGRRPWKPQVVGFHEAIAPGAAADAPPGTAASDSYGRGAHYLPVTGLKDFRRAYRMWWNAPPLGWERRSYEAVGLLGWAAATAEARNEEDLAETLESLRGRRFAGLDVRFDDDDHIVPEASSIGIWVVPRAGVRVPERDRLPLNLPWVPLARSFSAPGGRTRVMSRDWSPLFEGTHGSSGAAPMFTQMSFGVTTPASDRVH
jgi:ABC-type branched-subunit amino acid transport system substrate-binding protein